MDASARVNATVHDAFGANLSVAPLDLSGLLDRSSPDLVVLDAAEHCLEEVEHFVQRWATSPRSTRVLITSRRIPKAVDFLEIPPMTSPQARLLTRWVSGGATGPVTTRERALLDLCGGQPAALILKAREELAATVPESDSEAHNGPHTHATLPSADVARSFTLLSPPALEALLQLAVFEGPFTEEAARQIVDLEGFRHPPQFDHVIQALREQSLIQAVATADGIERESVPFTVRSTALSTLGRSGRRTAVGSRHTKWGIQRGRELAERVRLGDPEALVALSIEAADFRAIARRRARTGTGEALQALLALVPLKIAQSPLPERVKFLRDAMELAQRAPLDLRSKARRALSEALLAQGKFEEARDSLHLADLEVTKRKGTAPQEGPRIAALRVQLHRLAGEIEQARQIAYLALEQSGDDCISRGSISTELGVLQHAEGELDLALTTLHEAMDLLRNKDVPAYCRAAMATGDVLRAQGKGSQAASYYDQAKSHYSAIGERTGRALVLHAIGSLHLDNGKFDAAKSAFQEAKAHHADVGDHRGAALASGNLARLHHVLGDIPTAKKQYQDAILCLDEIGDARFAHIYRANEGTLLHELGDMEGALEAYQESIQPLLRMGDRRFAAMFLGRKAALEADAGATIEALHSLEQAERLVGETPDPVLNAALALHRTHVGLVSGSAGSPLHAAQEAIRDANSPGSAAAHSYDVRIAKRLLERSIQAFKPRIREVETSVVA
jgi:tetratricopeptide (TPR) repeat protein